MQGTPKVSVDPEMAMAIPTLTPPLPSSPAVDGEIRERSNVPPLRAGDHLTVEEFERRYEAMPWLKKAELIDGVVYVSPTTDENHGRPNGDLVTVLGIYRFNTPNILLGNNSSVKGLRGIHEPQPDSLLRIDPACVGQTTTDEKGYIQGAPELIGEISYNSASYDLHEKKEAYRRNYVQEYIVWRIEDQAIDWFRLREDQYEDMQPDAEGILKSEVFPGLWLHAEALLRGDFQKVQQVLQAGLASLEHQRLVQALQARRQS